MNKKLSLLLGLIGIVVTASATPVCPSGGSLSTYLASGYSCQLGDDIFSNFSYSSSASGGATAVAASGITVYTEGPGSDAHFGYSSNGFQFTASWDATAGQATDSNIGYTITTTGHAQLEDFFLGEAGPPTNAVTPDGAATVTENGCGPAPCTPNQFSAEVWMYGGPNYIYNFKPTDEVTFPLTDSATMDEVINVTGGANGDAHLNLVNNAFSELIIPEPMSAGFVGAGLALLGICCLRRREAKA